MPEQEQTASFDLSRATEDLLSGLGVPRPVAGLIVAAAAHPAKKIGGGAVARADRFLRDKVRGYDRLQTFLEKNVFAPDPTEVKLEKLRTEVISRFAESLSVLRELSLLLRVQERHYLDAREPVKKPEGLSPDDPFRLLEPHSGFVPLIGREKELERLQSFLETDAAFDLLVVTGPGGVGKTRLAQEFVRQAGLAGWAAGFLDGHALRSFVRHPDFPQWIPTLDTLIVVDYAAGKTQDLAPLIRRAASLALGSRHDEVPRLRLLLLEREAAQEGGWLESAIAGLEGSSYDLVRGLVARMVPLELQFPGNNSPVETTRELLWAAAASWRARFNLEPTNVGQLTDDQVGRLYERMQRRPLFVLAAAISSFHHGELDALTEWTWKRLLNDLVGWENRRWDKALGVGPSTLLGRAVRRGAVALQLLGEAGKSDDRLLRTFLERDLQELGYTSLDWGTVRDALGKVIPRTPAGAWESMGPDILAEAFWLSALHETAVRVSPVDTLRRLVHLAERQAWPVMYRAYADLHRVEGYGVIAQWLRELFGKLSTEELETAWASMPSPHLDLDPLGAEVGQALLVKLQEAGARPEKLAGVLNDLSVHLSRAGQRHEALKPAQEAVNIRRKLAQKNPDAFLPDLAMSLNNLATFLSELGQRHEALKPAQEAVNIYRKLAQKNPDAFLPNLATSLNNLATFLSELGQRHEALKPAQEAVNIRRKLAQKNPDAFLPNLGRSLGTRGTILLVLGKPAEATEDFREGLAVLLPLAERLPSAFSGLVTSLARDYLRACEPAGQEPDTDLLQRAREVARRAEEERLNLRSR